MNETEREIVALLQRRLERLVPLIREGNAFDYRYDEIESISAAIKRGEHRQHSPATVKDSQ